MSSLRSAAIALGSLLALAPRPALAYDVATSSKGAALHWDSEEITFTLALDPSPATLTVADGTAAAAASVAAWQAPMIEYGISVSLAPTSAAAAPHANDGVNTIRFAVDPADPDLEAGLLGRTFAVYQTSTGVLFDTDIVFNAVDFVWSPDVATCVEEYDLENALTHELGHALGLAHATGHPDATMFVTGDACETQKRDLDPDDLAGLASLYAASATCAPAESGCASSSPTGGLGLIALVVLALATARRRRPLRRAYAAALGAITATLLVGAPGTAEAGQLRRLDVPELDAHAAFVVHGRVVATRAIRGRGIETEATLVSDDCLAGTCPPALVVRRLGGELDGVGLAVEGEAMLAVGDEVVLFVRIDRERHARVAGGVQGALRIERGALATAGTDARTPVRAVRDLRGHRVLTPLGWIDGSREAFDLAQLRAQLRAR